MYWNGLGLVVDEYDNRELYIPYITCRAVIRASDNDVSGQTICKLWQLSRAQLGAIYVGFEEGEFTL